MSDEVDDDAQTSATGGSASGGSGARTSRAGVFSTILADVERLADYDVRKAKLSERRAVREGKKRVASTFDMYDTQKQDYWREKGVQASSTTAAAGGVAGVGGAQSARDAAQAMLQARTAQGGAAAAAAAAAGGGGGGGAASAGARDAASNADVERVGTKGRPWIIIAPRSGASLVTLRNAKQLLCDGQFMKPSDCEQAKGTVTFEIKRNNQVEHFVILDDPERYLRYEFNKEHWSRVLAVILQGAEWQLKSLNWSDVTEIFTHMRGVYFHFQDEQVPACIRKWSVHCLPLSRNKRHLDRTVLLKFWQDLDGFERRRKNDFENS